jgi:hypothetical protein
MQSLETHDVGLGLWVSLIPQLEANDTLKVVQHMGLNAYNPYIDSARSKSQQNIQVTHIMTIQRMS